MSSNKRDINMLVVKLKQDVALKIGAKSNMQNSIITERQKIDGTNFLKMLREIPYCNCRTVGQLVQKISSKRNKLLEEYKDLEKYASGYQMSLFDDSVPEEGVSFFVAKDKREKLDQEIKWLHKCLGICMNPNYFKRW